MAQKKRAAGISKRHRIKEQNPPKPVGITPHKSKGAPTPLGFLVRAIHDRRVNAKKHH